MQYRAQLRTLPRTATRRSGYTRQRLAGLPPPHRATRLVLDSHVAQLSGRRTFLLASRTFLHPKLNTLMDSEIQRNSPKETKKTIRQLICSMGGWVYSIRLQYRLQWTTATYNEIQRAAECM